MNDIVLLIPDRRPKSEIPAVGQATLVLQHAGLSVPERGSMTAVESPDPLKCLVYDAELCARLRAAGCQGMDWERFASVTYQKAVRTTYRWIVDGLMFPLCRSRSRAVDPGDLTAWSTLDIRALAHEVVAENFVLFARVGILGGDWDPAKGAGLFTYFMNGVVLCFPNVFRRKQRDRSRWEHKVHLYDDHPRWDQADDGTYSSSLSICAQLLKSLLENIRSPEQRQVAELYFIDCLGIRQIAEQLRTTDAAARGLLKRARQAMKSGYLDQGGGL